MTFSVMHDGEIVECRPVQALFTSPREPYTRELLSSVLDPEETA